MRVVLQDRHATVIEIVSRTVVQSYFGTGGSQGDVGGVRRTCRTCEFWESKLSFPNDDVPGSS
jgi:hypothetical protein